jgi:hypothetical protein
LADQVRNRFRWLGSTDSRADPPHHQSDPNVDQINTNIRSPGWASCLSRCLGHPGAFADQLPQRGWRAALKDSERFRSSTRTDCSCSRKMNAVSAGGSNAVLHPVNWRGGGSPTELDHHRARDSRRSTRGVGARRGGSRRDHGIDGWSCTGGAGAPAGAAGAQRRAVPDSGRRCRATGLERGAPASGRLARRVDALTQPVSCVARRSPCLIAAAQLSRL